VDRHDITALILDDHDTFRRGFAALDELQGPADSTPDPAALAGVWRPLADLLDVHAAAEEEIFYPRLLRAGSDGVDETVDAIGDHNDIRDAIRQADAAAVGTAAWWAGVNAARAANTEHMAEEEDDALADYRRHTDADTRRTLGRAFLEFKATHRTAASVDTSDKDPHAYVAAQLPARDPSLRIGSLR
jgi:Hemerythrin HHE cation binding domain